MIPKIIHYCWFGGAEIPGEYAGYISEWQQLHPEWEIKRWDESNIPNNFEYLKSALAGEFFANMSNFTRLYALKEFGGIYLDVDFKLLKPLDTLLNNACFFGFEEGDENKTTFWVNNAVCGAEKGHDFIQACFEELVASFNGTEQANLSSPHLTTNLLVKKRNLQKYGQQLLGDITLFAKEVFYPIPWNLAKQVKNYTEHLHANTIAVHMWGRTWFSKEMMLRMIDDLQAWTIEQDKCIQELKQELENERSKVSLISKKLTEVQAEADAYKLQLKETITR